MKTHGGRFFVAGLLFFATVRVGTSCFAQTPPRNETRTSGSSSKTNELPFDRLELFSFFAAGPVPSYASYIIQLRRTNFTPDATFISSFSSPAVRSILQSIKQRTAGAADSNRDQAYELARKAYGSQHNRAYASAWESYRQALNLAPNSATLHLAYAAALLLSQNFADADEQIQTSIKLWPENCEAHAMLALSMVLQRRSHSAEIESKEALRIFPQHSSAKFTLAQSLTNEHKYPEALPAIRSAITALPSMTALTKFFGIALLETGKTAGGIEQLMAYLRMAPDDAEGHYYLGVALRVNGNNADAHAQFAEAVHLQPKNPQYQAAANPDEFSAADSTAALNPEETSFLANEYSNRFFGFIYPLPKGWKVLSPLSARTLIENIGARMATSDPTSQDMKRVEAKLVHPLLYARSVESEETAFSTELVIISAIDARFADTATAVSYADAASLRILETGMPGETRSAPEKVSIGGRSFWKARFVIRTERGPRYETEFVAETRGYLLRFTFGAPDLGSLSEIEKSMDSVQFQSSQN